jgi:IS30 family transposase
MENPFDNLETNFKHKQTTQPTSNEEKERIKSLALKGLGVNEIAREVKRSPATVSRLLRSMKISKAITIAKAGKLLDEKLDASEQLKKINKKANQILDSTDPASPEIVLKAMAEIRGQLKLQLEIFQALYNVEEVAKWQNEVMDILGEVAPDARDRFYQRMHERRPL